MQQTLDRPAPSARVERDTLRLPRSFHAAHEALLALSLFWLYRQVRRWTGGDVDGAMANAGRVVDLERTAGVFTELDVQRLALDQRWLIEFLDHYYVLVHFPVTALALIWVFVRGPHLYRRVRNCFLVVTAAGLLIHVVFPLAPPRMLVNRGFVDTLDRYGPDIYSSDVTNSAANQLAAMPSLHFAWALLVALVVCAVRPMRSSRLAFVHPAITLLAIVATGNHYWLDAAVGGSLVVFAWHLTDRRGASSGDARKAWRNP